MNQFNPDAMQQQQQQQQQATTQDPNALEYLTSLTEFDDTRGPSIKDFTDDQYMTLVKSVIRVSAEDDLQLHVGYILWAQEGSELLFNMLNAAFRLGALSVLKEQAP